MYFVYNNSIYNLSKAIRITKNKHMKDYGLYIHFDRDISYIQFDSEEELNKTYDYICNQLQLDDINEKLF